MINHGSKIPRFGLIQYQHTALLMHTGIRKSRSGREAKAEHVEKDGGFIGMKADADVEKDGKFVGMYITLRYILYALESTK